MKHLLISFIVATVLTPISYWYGIHYEYIKELNWLEIFSVWTSYSATYLCVVQTRNNYIIGAVSVFALCALFWQQKLYGSMALQVYLIFEMIYGWFRWRRDDITRPVTHIGNDWQTWLTLPATPILFYLIIKTSNYFDGNYVLLDSIIFVLSMIAQFWLDNKKLETWLVWIVVDVISVWEYWNQGLFVLAIQMGLFILNAIWGYWLWNKSRKVEIITLNLEDWKTPNGGLSNWM